MEAITANALAELLVNILLKCFSQICLTMIASFVWTIINNHKHGTKKAPLNNKQKSRK